MDGKNHMSEIQFKEWFNSKTHRDKQSFCTYIKNVHGIHCDDLRKSYELIKSAYEYYSYKNKYQYPVLELYFNKKENKDSKAHIYLSED